MDKHLIYGIALSILLSGMVIPADILWQKWTNFREFEDYLEEVSTTVHEQVKAEDAVANESYINNVEEWNDEFSDKVDRLYSAHSRKNNKEINTSMELSRKLFNSLLKLKAEFAFNVEPLFSKRMNDKRTVGDRDEHDWRMHTLEDIHRYLINYDSRFTETIDVFQQEISGSELPEKYRIYFWQEWFHQNIAPIKKILPDTEEFIGKTDAYSRFYDYMYYHKDGYYLAKNGEIIITNRRYISDYSALLRALGSG